MSKREKTLKCPFCGSEAAPPAPRKVGYEDFDGGTCPCGSVYVYERTLRRQGEAYMSAIIFAYNGDYDAALGAGEGDYEEATIRYDQRTGNFYEGDGAWLDRSPRFHFIKLKKKL